MTIEGRQEQFNEEKFKEEFKTAIEDYSIVADDLSLFRGDEDFKEKERGLTLEESLKMDYLIKLTTEALKSSPNKQGILDVIHEVVYGINIKYGDPNDHSDIISEAALLRGVIIEIVRI